MTSTTSSSRTALDDKCHTFHFRKQFLQPNASVWASYVFHVLHDDDYEDDDDDSEEDENENEDEGKGKDEDKGAHEDKDEGDGKREDEHEVAREFAE